MPAVERGTIVTFGVSGGLGLIAGIAIEAIEASKESACSSAIPGGGLLGIPGPSRSACDAANVWSGVGLVLIVAGLALIVLCIVFAFKRKTRRMAAWSPIPKYVPPSVPAGWYPHSADPRFMAYWDGNAWRPEAGFPPRNT